MKARRMIYLLLLAGIAVPTAALAQEGEKRNPQEMVEAQQRVREAQRQLEHAMQELQAAQGDAANRALREAIEELRSAQRQLQTGELQSLAERFQVERDRPGAVSVFVSENRPKMGVLLEESTYRSGQDSLGVRLSGVTPGGPAEEAGLKAGDVIVSAKGTALGRMTRRDPSPSARLRDIIRELDEGQTLRVEYLRDGGRKSADVVLRELEPEAYSFSFISPDSNAFSYRFAMPFLEELEGPERVRIRSGSPMVMGGLLPFGLFDMELVSLNAELGRYFGTSEGLLVVRAPSDGLTGLQSGDVIVSIDGRKPTNPSHALRIIRSYGAGESMKMEVMRDKRRQTITVTIPQRERGMLWEQREPMDG
ncbi:MAG: PDZ domain-containing protein [Gemmatimonadota bacterium]|nr:PDZ domain-containing protein [Gemmatimonadota bacterium]MDH3366936.1 PDZ domain-containing protein [Gemmatimonadota bacterium]MDH3477535.1 PDZ domain-containing protein [Gemmatimonadota bacterium]MDH3569737.1 PDZ domain-containing protein [Gemmatimonadota bacterium]MDH5550692.1 PDZ domain-containing protein [Gemmatimonadota bacterium]